MKKIASAFLNEPTEKVFPASEVSKKISDKAHCLGCLVDLAKAKLAISNNKQNIQQLALAPQTWGIGQVVEVLETTELKLKKLGNFYHKKDYWQSLKITKQNAFLIILSHLCNLSVTMAGFQYVYQEQSTLLVREIRSICKNSCY